MRTLVETPCGWKSSYLLYSGRIFWLMSLRKMPDAGRIRKLRAKAHPHELKSVPVRISGPIHPLAPR